MYMLFTKLIIKHQSMKSLQFQLRIVQALTEPLAASRMNPGLIGKHFLYINSKRDNNVYLPHVALPKEG